MWNCDVSEAEAQNGVLRPRSVPSNAACERTGKKPLGVLNIFNTIMIYKRKMVSSFKVTHLLENVIKIKSHQKWKKLCYTAYFTSSMWLRLAVVVYLESSIDEWIDCVIASKCRHFLWFLVGFHVVSQRIWYVIPRERASRLVGTSLLQEIVYLVSQGADPDEIGLMNIDEQLPVLEYPQPGLDIIQVMDSALLVWMKLSWAAANDPSTIWYLCVATGADVAAAHQKPPSLSIPPHSPAQRRG